jgi:ADP-ribose pyrophosphatase YjhB (NUDIX family)
MSAPKIARLAPQAAGVQSEETVHISAFAVIKSREQLLLVKRIRPEFTAGKWTLPASIINFGEDPEVAIKRIVREQLGAEPKKATLLQVQSFGDKHWDLCFVYQVSIDNVGKLSPDIERADYFPTDKLPPEFRSDHKEVLDTLATNI